MMEQVAGASESQNGALRVQSSLEFSRETPGATISPLNSATPSGPALRTLKADETFGLKPKDRRQQAMYEATDANEPDVLERYPSQTSHLQPSTQNLDLCIAADSQDGSLRSSRLDEPTARDYGTGLQQTRAVRNDLSFTGPPAASRPPAEPQVNQDYLDQN